MRVFRCRFHTESRRFCDLSATDAHFARLPGHFEDDRQTATRWHQIEKGDFIMRKLVIGMALASTALATPALARDNSWYVEVDGGAMIVEDLNFSIGTTASAAKQDHEYGYDFGGIIGYDFGMFRLEAEASFREADPENLTTTVRIPAAGSVASLRSGIGSYSYVAGDSNALSFMLNG